MNTEKVVRLALKDQNPKVFKGLAATCRLASFDADAIDLIGRES